MPTKKIQIDLLAPRYKVIADYPKSNMSIGKILKVEDDFFYIGDGYAVEESYLTKFPHLFKKLEWWEERKEEEMPKYIKHPITWMAGFKYYQVDAYATNMFNEVYAKTKDSETGNIFLHNAQAVPATEAEYNSFIKK